MVTTTNEVIFLGNFADADTNEGTDWVEDESIYSGVFGSVGAPLFAEETNVTFTDSNGNGRISTDNVGGEPIEYDLGAGTVTTTVDSLAVVDLTVTYMDGSTASFIDAVMFQDSTGNLFLTNSDFAGTDLNSPSQIQSINVTNVYDTNFFELYNENLQDFACYVSGTHIRTINGDIPIEQLSVGDQVATQDHGFQPIRWIKGEKVARSVKMNPVRINAGALGAGMPVNDLLVSQQHRVMVRSRILSRMTGEAEAFVIAKKLVDLPGIDFDIESRPITYFHLMCDEHEVIFSNGAPSETLYPGEQALTMIGTEARNELLSIFPSLMEEKSVARLARKELKGVERQNLIFRHKKNNKALLSDLLLCA